MKKSTYSGTLLMLTFFSGIMIFISVNMLLNEHHHGIPFGDYYPSFKTILFAVIIIILYISLLIKCFFPLYKDHKEVNNNIDFYEYTAYLVFLGIFPIIVIFMTFFITL